MIGNWYHNFWYPPEKNWGKDDPRHRIIVENKYPQGDDRFKPTPKA